MRLGFLCLDLVKCMFLALFYKELTSIKKQSFQTLAESYIHTYKYLPIYERRIKSDVDPTFIHSKQPPLHIFVKAHLI